jgi:hypothetical protein
MGRKHSKAIEADTATRFDPYRPLSRNERLRQRRRVLEVLRARSGSLDFHHLRLSKREAFFANLPAPSQWTGDLDRAGLVSALLRRGPVPDDPKALWLFVAAKASESENYGVDLEVRRRTQAGPEHSSEDQLYLLLEERYHTRILGEICRVCGIELELPRPPWPMRILIRLFEYLPGPVRYIGILSGEVLGCVIFNVLAQNTFVFREQPAVEERLQALLAEILRDELWHVVLCRTQLGRVRIRLARWLAPVVVAILMREIPELLRLGYSRADILRCMRAGLFAPSEMDSLEGTGATA